MFHSGHILEAQINTLTPLHSPAGRLHPASCLPPCSVCVYRHKDLQLSTQTEQWRGVREQCNLVTTPDLAMLLAGGYTPLPRGQSPETCRPQQNANKIRKIQVEEEASSESESDSWGLLMWGSMRHLSTVSALSVEDDHQPSPCVEKQHQKGNRALCC